MAKLRMGVHVFDDKGERHYFSAGEEVPDWVRKAVPNPKAWDGYKAPERTVRTAARSHGTAQAVRVDAEGRAVPLDEDEYASHVGAQRVDEAGVPPRSGPGSGRGAWADFARQHGVEVNNDDTRDDIAERCERAGAVRVATPREPEPVEERPVQPAKRRK